MKTVPELLTLPHQEACAYIDALTDEEKITLRKTATDWLVDELKFAIVHGKRRKDASLET